MLDIKWNCSKVITDINLPLAFFGDSSDDDFIDDLSDNDTFLFKEFWEENDFCDAAFIWVSSPDEDERGLTYFEFVFDEASSWSVSLSDPDEITGALSGYLFCNKTSQ